MWELDYKESWVPKNWCFWIVVWRRLLRVPWTARRFSQSILKEISPGCSLEGLMLKLKLQYFGHLMGRTNSFEKTLMLGMIQGGRRRGWQRMRWLDGITDSMVMHRESWWTAVYGVTQSQTRVKRLSSSSSMYGCESWTIKKAECQRIDAFELWFWRRLLRVLWTARRSNQSILKEISPEYLLEGLMLKVKLQYFGHLMWRTQSLENTLMLGKFEGRRKRRQQRMRCLDGITNLMDMCLSMLC